MPPVQSIGADSISDQPDTSRVFRATSRKPVAGSVNVWSAAKFEMLEVPLSHSIDRGWKSRIRAGDETLKLPNRERAEIRPEKIRGYLLSSNHPSGQHKSSVYFSLEYTFQNWERLSADLLALAHSGDAERLSSPYGEKFRIVGRIVGPNGRSMVLLLIWLRRHGDPIPRLVTAYPAR